MKRLSFLFIAVFALTMTTSCKNEKKDTRTEVKEEMPMETKTNDIKKMQIALESKSGSSVKGNAVFTEEDGVVTMVAVVGSLKEGEHAIHLHEKADCSADDGTSSGGHWNPTNQPHGKWGSPDGYHKGDIGNFMADANGNGTITITTDEWCIDCGDANKDIVGKAIIIHENVDDFTTQPTGNAGGRVSCGGIIQ
ncbi:superoxide dismutase family protein [Gelidibacter salicanalis]|uniref:Superoxide dismutase [Cu-Zn] n=1 Tax=Gelidibacter salicanalis TaxID=291193 RepID=A0A934KXM5_9FLAO|nr:superoxide dismutase family protein [Gelidibacter salicanalis]MBJ7881185.1 superoxide dismutase family protein [Gelidibacter salicanalis]